jgi:hypothetical protein
LTDYYNTATAVVKMNAIPSAPPTNPTFLKGVSLFYAIFNEYKFLSGNPPPLFTLPDLTSAMIDTNMNNRLTFINSLISASVNTWIGSNDAGSNCGVYLASIPNIANKFLARDNIAYSEAVKTKYCTII